MTKEPKTQFDAPKEPIFKNSVQSHYTKALFYEEAIEPDRKYVLYTLKNKDYMGYPSIQRLYLEEDDPTEYTFALKYFDSWKHWTMIRDAKWFEEVYSEMRENLRLRMRSKALADLRLSSKDPKNTVQVNKYLLDEGWIEKKDTRGRPSKEKIKEEANKIFLDMEDVEKDWERLGLAVEKPN